MLRKESLSALEDFKKVRAKHEKLKELFDRLEEVPLPSSQGKIFAVVGATGAGKSTAVGHFFDSYKSDQKNRCYSLRLVGRIPWSIRGDS
ncbi:hypothetical protein [Chromobacterium amazonense]|uniref:hypothetical protein n=1 Tax=Chromobacterium amazonense TaxID=1382803 RepID=UPI0021B6EFCF|nr:hypothetical protein [Chromobacterium amazonense]MDE1716144.1 hypothetical protein [Chromobacterium amazonense]